MWDVLSSGLQFGFLDLVAKFILNLGMLSNEVKCLSQSASGGIRRGKYQNPEVEIIVEMM